jgi:hypothetical protein
VDFLNLIDNLIEVRHCIPTLVKLFRVRIRPEVNPEMCSSTRLDLNLYKMNADPNPPFYSEKNYLKICRENWEQ